MVLGACPLRSSSAAVSSGSRRRGFSNATIRASSCSSATGGATPLRWGAPSRPWGGPGAPRFRHPPPLRAPLRAFAVPRSRSLLAPPPAAAPPRGGAGPVRVLAPEAPPRPAVVLTPRADDEDVVLLACRRSTFEWALRASVAARPAIELREGVT